MNQYAYLACTLLSYFVQLVLSILVKDIGILFEAICAISYSNLSFFLPGIFYLLAQKKYATQKLKDNSKHLLYESIFFIVVGLLTFLLLLS
jgi:hypothetical protein